ncbi:MAG: cytochrome b N-terminal domain-containing protein [Planctomycetia bacterium]|nr:cytochrome b N-terminal domain-containing protein [Planctomycetia bacterium]
MKALLNWLDDRTGVRDFVHEALFERIPGGARWRYVWGSTLVFAFAVQAITGISLWMCYSPSTQTAWESVYFIQNQMQGGWLLRGLHHFMAHAMVVLMALHLMQVVIDGAYRAPREVNFWLGLLLMQIVLGLSLTGYLLPWDQKGYWATRVATNLLSVVPVVGPQLQQLVVGGSDYGHHTLTRFFALHAGLLPGLLVFFLALHVALFRRHGICHKQPAKGPDAMFWPDQVLKDAVACLAVMIVVLVLVAQPVNLFLSEHRWPIETSHLGAELGAPADPSNQYSAARPEWYFLFLFQFLKLFEGGGEQGELLGAIVIPGLIMLSLFLLPFLGRWNLGHRFNVGLILILFAGIALLTGAALNEDYRKLWTDPSKFAQLPEIIDEVGTDDQKIAAHFQNDKAKIDKFQEDLIAFEKYKKSKDYLEAVEQAETEAQRVTILASTETRIPVSGAITLLRNDPKTQGPKLFAARCASCHTYAEPAATQGDAQPAKEPAAPNLFGFASRAWLKSFLDPKHIAGPNYFGNTSHRDGEMVGFVNETLKDWPAEEIQNAVMALSAEALLKRQANEDQKDLSRIEAGRKLIADAERCVQCHKFHDAGETGSAPDLTGYGSREWLVGMISNPRHQRFYGDNNDGMPAFAEHPGDSPENMLATHAIGLLVDWLRGEWYEPPDGDTQIEIASE